MRIIDSDELQISIKLGELNYIINGFIKLLI